MGLNVNRETVKALVAEYLDHPVEKLNESDQLIDDLGLDSLDSIELVMFLEERLGYEIKDDDVDHIKTVGDLIDAVARSTP